MSKQYYPVFGFKVRFSRSHSVASVFDGDELYFRAYVRSFSFYLSECAEVFGYFFTDDGTKYIHWTDTEMCVDFLTKA